MHREYPRQSQEMGVSDEPFLSDFMQILYDLESHAPSGPTWARNPRKTNWGYYPTELQAALQEITMEIRDAETLESAFDLFTWAITTANLWNKKLENLWKETRDGFKRPRWFLPGSPTEGWGLCATSQKLGREQRIFSCPKQTRTDGRPRKISG